MYFWNTDALLGDIANDKVTERQKYSYYIFFAILGTILTSIIFETTLDIQTQIINTIIYAALTYVLLQMVFSANADHDGEDTIARLTMISLPIFIKVMLVFIVAGFLSGLLGFEEIMMSDKYAVVWEVATILVIYWRVISAFGRLKNISTEAPA